MDKNHHRRRQMIRQIESSRACCGGMYALWTGRFELLVWASSVISPPTVAGTANFARVTVKRTCPYCRRGAQVPDLVFTAGRAHQVSCDRRCRVVDRLKSQSSCPGLRGSQPLQYLRLRKRISLL